LQVVKTEIQQLPDRSLSYATLRYMSADAATRAQLAAMPQPDVFFNYLASSVAPEVSEYKVSGPYNGRLFTIDETTLQPTPILVTGYLADGQLQASWHYSANQYRSETMDRLANQTMEELRMLLTQFQQKA
ncbi:MAG TPA: hypothetical protein VKB76_05495, partial [Ktedonobacterales bacterium]|nr:hypothetical protein [Ktedonobacterales bacterium]